MTAVIKKALADKKLQKPLKIFAISLCITVILACMLCMVSYADEADEGNEIINTNPGVTITVNGADTKTDRVESLEILFLMTILALLPSILIMLTAFTRIIIVLSFVRNAMGLQQTPPNQVLIGLALFLTLFIMQPVITEIKDVSYTPYVEGEITQSEAIKAAEAPIKKFMLKQTKNKDLSLFISLSKEETPQKAEDVSMLTLVPAFIVSEIKRAFTAGLLLYVPFIVIDMVVSSVLMSMGMIMLPPTMIAMPFKIMVFLITDGWGLLIKSLVMGF